MTLGVQTRHSSQMLVFKPDLNTGNTYLHVFIGIFEVSTLLYLDYIKNLQFKLKLSKKQRNFMYDSPRSGLCGRVPYLQFKFELRTK